MKINDSRRIQLLWEEILSQHLSKSQPQINLQEGAKQVLLDYAEELALSIVESAALVAQSRGSSQIEETDISLLLAKKLGVEIAGHEVDQPLYRNNLKSSVYATTTDKSNSSEQKRGTKRKHGG